MRRIRARLAPTGERSRGHPKPVLQPIHRRQFLSGGASAALLCALGERSFPFATASDVKAADAAARRVKRPAPIPKDPVDTMTFPTPQPQPGGQAREYWIQARPLRWDPVPTKRDEWMNMPIPSRRKFMALAYQQYSAGFAEPIGAPTIPGPILEAEVGDTLVVHFRNGDHHFGQAHTMHPHGVKYTPDYDGSYLASFTRAGGFVAPGDEFTYTWEAVPGSAGVWPYHDHGPNGTISVARGLFGAVIVREKGAKPPDVEQVLVLHQLTAADHARGDGLPMLQRARVRRQHADHPRQGGTGRGPARLWRRRHVPHLPRARPPLAERCRRARG